MRTFTLIAALLFAPAALADDIAKKPAETAKKAAKLSKAELQVVAHYHELNQMEIDLGKLAVKKGKAEGVKEYGRMLIKDHGDSDKKLLALAKQRGQSIPMEKPATEIEKQDKAEQKAQAAKLKKLEGAEFDTAFLAAMVQGHEKELAKVDTKVAEVQDTELADMVRAKKPVLQHHADHARELQNQSNQVSSAPSTPPAPPSGVQARKP